MFVKAPEIRFRKIHDRCNRTSCRCEAVDMDDISKFLDDINIGVSRGDNGDADEVAAAARLGGPDRDPDDPLSASEEAKNGGGGGTSNEQHPMDSEGQASSSGSGGGKRAPPCGAQMPRFTREGLTIFVHYPDDTENIPGTGQKKQVRCGAAECWGLGWGFCRIALHCVVLYCTALCCIALHFIALCYIALHCAALRCVVLCCILLHYVVSHYISLHYVVLHCIALHCFPWE
jgi:hypothetical protein